MLILAPAISSLAGDPIRERFDALWALPFFLPLAYSLGLAPALTTAAFDLYLASRNAHL